MKEHVNLKDPARATKYTHKEVVVCRSNRWNTKSASYRVNGFFLPTVKSNSFGQIPRNNSINRVGVVEYKQIEPSCWVFKLDRMESNPATLLKSIF